MRISNVLRAVALTAVVLGLAAAAAQADECETMTKSVQVLIDKMDPAAKGGGVPRQDVFGIRRGPWTDQIVPYRR
jgi:hypothetical protein